MLDQCKYTQLKKAACMQIINGQIEAILRDSGFKLRQGFVNHATSILHEDNESVGVLREEIDFRNPPTRHRLQLLTVSNVTSRSARNKLY